MNKFYVPTDGQESWRRLLARPEKHWKAGFSAKCLAEAWEGAKGDFPPEIKALFSRSEGQPFPDIRILVAFPEWKTLIPPRQRHASQNDLFVIGKDDLGKLTTIMVEGKVAESFGQRLGEWRSSWTRDKEERLNCIVSKLGLKRPIPDAIRYQLLHRMASAVFEAEQFRAENAVMVVHSFDPDISGFGDFAAFLGLFDWKAVSPGFLYRLGKVGEIDIHAGWATSRVRE